MQSQVGVGGQFRPCTWTQVCMRVHMLHIQCRPASLLSLVYNDKVADTETLSSTEAHQIKKQSDIISLFSATFCFRCYTSAFSRYPIRWLSMHINITFTECTSMCPYVRCMLPRQDYCGYHGHTLLASRTGVPNPHPLTGTSPGPVRNRATQQEVSSR